MTARPARPGQVAQPCNCATTDRDAEIARMESMPDAPESLRERVKEAIWAEAKATVHYVSHFADDETREKQRDQRYLALADAAIATITTPTEVAP